MGAWIETIQYVIVCAFDNVAPLWERGLKPTKYSTIATTISRSLMGAWIETQSPVDSPGLERVAPLWERGLKQHTLLVGMGYQRCRSLMGAWIETVSV